MTQVTPLNGRGKGCIRFPNSVSFACSVCAAQSQKLRVGFFYFPDDLIFFSKDQFVHANNKHCGYFSKEAPENFTWKECCLCVWKPINQILKKNSH